MSTSDKIGKVFEDEWPAEPEPEPSWADRARQARQYVKDHDASVTYYSRMGRVKLQGIVISVMRDNGIVPLIGGPAAWSKDELVGWLIARYYPRARLEEAQVIRWTDEGIALDPDAWGPVLDRLPPEIREAAARLRPAQ